MSTEAGSRDRVSSASLYFEMTSSAFARWLSHAGLAPPRELPFLVSVTFALPLYFQWVVGRSVFSRSLLFAAILGRMLGRKLVVGQSGKLRVLGLDRKPPGRYGDGAGPYFLVDKAGARRWMFRFRWKDDRARITRPTPVR